MDILGPFPLAKGQVKFLIVAINYFSKWIEAEPLATITAQQVQKFCWKNVICRNELSHCLVTNNGRKFIDGDFERFLQQRYKILGDLGRTFVEEWSSRGC